jgi:hypothetical protein
MDEQLDKDGGLHKWKSPQKMNEAHKVSDATPENIATARARAHTHGMLDASRSVGTAFIS